MKKRTIAAFMLIAVLCAGTTVSAHHGGGHHRAAAASVAPQAPSVAYCAYVDADCDGVCDNCASHCDGYVDADGDGICDSCQNTGLHTDQGTHCYTSDSYYYSQGCGHRHGHCY